MAHIIIAGRPNSEDTSECILLAENLHANFPTVRYIKVLKHSDEWENYSNNICNLFGFKNSHPLIFYSNGRFIGGKDEFFKLVECNFKFDFINNNLKLNIDSNIVKTLTKEHITITDEEYFTRISGSKIKDKIESKFEEISRDDFEVQPNLNRYNTLDTFYEIEFIGEMKVFYKYSNKYLPDHNSKEYIQYGEPVENKMIIIDRNNNIVNESERKETEHEEEEEEEEDNPIPRKREIKYQENQIFETPFYLFENKNKYVIVEDYGLKYKLIINPFFTFYGETIIYHEDNQNESEKLQIKDYGKIPSLRKIKYDENILPIIKPLLNEAPVKVSSLESNTISDNFLSDQDIHYLVKSVKEINGMACLRILPQKFNDYKQFGSSKIKILKLPLKDINYEDIPLCGKIEQTIRKLKRDKIKKVIEEDLNHSNNSNKKEKRIDCLLDNEEFTHFFEIKEFLKLETFCDSNVKHLIKNYTWQYFNSNSVTKDIQLMMKELNLTMESGHGFNLLLTKNFLFIAPLIKPFTYDSNNTPLFADPYFFAGIFNLPLIKAEWPETIKNEYVQFNLKEVLEKSTNI